MHETFINNDQTYHFIPLQPNNHNPGNLKCEREYRTSNCRSCPPDTGGTTDRRHRGLGLR